MADRDGLGQPGRAAGEQDQPVVLVGPHDLFVGGVTPVDPGPSDIVQELGAAEHMAVDGGGDHGGEAGTRHRQLHAAGGLDQGGDLLGPQRRVHQCRGSADPGGAEHGGDRKKIADLDHRHPVARLYAGARNPRATLPRRRRRARRT